MNMEFLINLPMGAPILSRETVLFALISGLIIGAFISSTEIATAYAASKLRINEKEVPLKYFALIVGIGGVIAIFLSIAIQVLGPGRAQTGIISDRAIEELGIALYFGLGLLGTSVIVIPLKLLSNRIASK